MSQRMNVRGVWMVGAMGMLVVGAMVFGGPITPPGGAIAPTGRTLDEIFNKVPVVGAADGRIPIAGGTSTVTISQPGSYVLTGNITVSSGSGININASDVTLDLNGFRVMTTANSGTVIVINTGTNNVVVRNGLVAGGNTGVACTNNAVGALIEDVAISGTKITGISLSGGCRGCIIHRCRVSDTGSTTTAADASLGITGISNGLAIGTRIEDCSVSRLFYNGSGTGTLRGISMGGSASAVIGCNVYHDGALTGTGIAGTGSVYRNNTVTNFGTAYSGGTDGGGNF